MATSPNRSWQSLSSSTNVQNEDSSLSCASSISESTPTATVSNSSTQTNQSTCSLEDPNVEASPRNPARPDLPFYDLRSGSTPKTPKTVIRKPVVKRTKKTQVSTKLVEVCAKVNTGRTTGGVRRGRPPANSNTNSTEVAPSPLRARASSIQPTSSARPSTARRSSIPLPSPVPSALPELNTSPNVSVPSEVEHGVANNSQIIDMEDTQYGIESIASNTSQSIESVENVTVKKETVPVQRRRSFTINIQRSNQTTKIVVDGEDEVNITIPDEIEPVTQGISTVPEAATPVENKEKTNPKPCCERKSRSHRKSSKKSSSRRDRKKGRNRRSRCDCCCYCSDDYSSSYSCSTCSSDSSFYTYSSDYTEYSPVSVKKSGKTHRKS